MELLSDYTFKEFLLSIETESLKAMLKEQCPIIPNETIIVADQDNN